MKSGDGLSVAASSKFGSFLVDFRIGSWVDINRYRNVWTQLKLTRIVTKTEKSKLL